MTSRDQNSDFLRLVRAINITRSDALMTLVALETLNALVRGILSRSGLIRCEARSVIKKTRRGIQTRITRAALNVTAVLSFR